MEKVLKKFKPKSGSFFEVFQYKDLLLQLVRRDLKLKYRRSVLGYVWSVLNPLLVMIVLTIVFSAMFSRSIPNFPVYLIIGRTMYDFVIGATNKALGAITDNASLLKKTYVSKFMFPLAKITSSMVDYVLSLGALIIVLIFTGSRFYWTMLLFPIIVLQAYIFALGLGFFLAQMHVFFRDTRYIYNAVTTMWMYCTAIFYPIDMLPHYLRVFVENFNPLFIYVNQFRDIVWKGVLPSGHDLILGTLYALVFFALGTFIFKKKQDKFILYI
ncbi:MAG: ABC transporter permease [Oscillospiraceae bacterium]